VAGEGGFEPPHTDPETAVLPLDDSPTEPFHHITAQIRRSNRHITQPEHPIGEASAKSSHESFIGSDQMAIGQFCDCNVHAVISAAPVTLGEVDCSLVAADGRLECQDPVGMSGLCDRCRSPEGPLTHRSLAA
jgi:hypothetical protein